MNTLAKTEDVARWSPEQKELIKRTVAKDASDDELRMFLHIASVSGLDPLLKQIHFTKMGGRVSIIADVNGLQARAARAPDFEGIACATVYEKDDFLMDQKTGEVVKHVNNPFSQGRPVGAWAVVRREGKLPFVSCVRFNEYDNPNNALWKSKPSVMILKCAKSTALRLAYPEQFSGIYDEAELGKEEREINPPPPPSEQATHAAAVKKQLASRLKVVAVQEGETEQQAAARTQAEEVAPPTAKEPSVFERICIALTERGVAEDRRGSIIKGATGKEKQSQLVEEDIAKVLDAVAALRAATPEDAPF